MHPELVSPLVGKFPISQMAGFLHGVELLPEVLMRAPAETFPGSATEPDLGSPIVRNSFSGSTAAPGRVQRTLRA